MVKLRNLKLVCSGSTLFLLMYSASLYAEDSLMSFEDFKDHHEAIISVLMEADQKNEYDNLYPVEGEYSTVYFNVEKLIQFNVHAQSSGICFFGGWPSYKRKGMCKEPWKFNMNPEFGLSYDKDHFCGHKNMFRCNPILFGPGDGENSQDNNGSGKGAGKCINYKKNGGSIKSVTKQCFDQTKDNSADLYKMYVDNPEYRKNFDKMKKEVTLFCSENSQYSACSYLMGRVKKLEEAFLCLSREGENNLEIVSDEIENFLDIPTHIGLKTEVSSLAPQVLVIPRARPENLVPAKSNENVSQQSGRGECDIAGTSESWKRNCNKLLSSGNIPKNALRYALKVMKKNATSFETDQCFEMASSKHYSMRGLTRKKLNGIMADGIPNKCQMMINNYDERISTHGGAYKCKAAQYYVDLCSGNAPKVEKSFSYVGYGTCKSGRGFKNQSGQGTTVLGAFLTGNHTFNFQKRDASYSSIAKGLGGVIPATPLIGLQKSNNGASPDLKYLHVGAYTSAGCPSVPPKDANKIKKLASKGPSLVLNYKEGQMEDINRCSK